MKTILKTLAIAGIVSLAAGGANAAETLKFGSSQPAKGGYMGEVVKVLGDAIEQNTGGKLKMKAFYSGALSSNERELAEMAQSGAVDFSNAATTYILGWAPSAKVFDLPYLYQGVEHYTKVIKGEVGDFVKKEVEGAGVKIITYVLPGIRSIFNNERPIMTLEDAKGLKIRSMQSPVYIEMFKSMGMLPTPMPSSELYTALQLGTVDAGRERFRPASCPGAGEGRHQVLFARSAFAGRSSSS